MMPTGILLLGGLWIACGILTTGMTFAYFEGEFPTLNRQRDHLGFGVFMGLFGPIGLLIALLLSGFAQHGIRFRSRHKQET